MTAPGCVIDGVTWDVAGDFGSTPFILDRDHLDADLLEPADVAAFADHVGELLVSASWQWGSSRSLGPLTAPTAGGATLTLLDTLRTFDPLNASSPAFQSLKPGLPVRITADGAPAFTGKLRTWAHDLGTLESTLELVDVIGELGLIDVPAIDWQAFEYFASGWEGATAYVAAMILKLSGFADPRMVALPLVEGVSVDDLGATVTAASPRAMIVSPIASPDGWPASAFGQLAPAPATGSVLEALAAVRFAELGSLTGSPEGRAYWRGSEPFTPPAPVLSVNCGGVFLAALTASTDFDRIRNQVRITPAAGPDLVWIDAASIERFGVREVASSTDALRFETAAMHVSGGMPDGDPYTRWANAILDAMAAPRPLVALGTLRPKGPAEVGPIAHGRAFDRWRVISEESYPPLDFIAELVGARCSLRSTGLEVDATTEYIG